VLWPVQRRAATELWHAIADGHDALIDKSRDMGASWLCLGVFAWWWRFMPDSPFLIASRKEEYVDSKGNMDTLFAKLDYLLARLPSWMRPRVERKHMHLLNLNNGSLISGESTNGDLGRGGRRKAILLDEFAACENGDEILAATADATPCRLFNSTPQGRGNAFAEVRFSGKVQIVTLHWREHPEKGKGAELVDGKWTSPWYRAECARRTSKKEIAQELDIDYLASGDAYFDLDILQTIRGSGQLRKPLHVGAITYDMVRSVETGRERLTNARYTEDTSPQRLSLWCDLVNGRPLQNRSYVVFADISNGQGASNSVIKVACCETREEIASFACPDTPPHELARVAVAVCKWLGGHKTPLLGWEANGPGGIFGLEVQRLGYGTCLRMRELETAAQEATDKLGWFSTRRSKEALLGSLRSAVARGEYIIRDEATIAEMEQYICYKAGGLGPSRLANEPDGARAAHGDRVIAAAGIVLCMAEMPLVRPEELPPPVNSFADRRRQFELAQRRADQW